MPKGQHSRDNSYIARIKFENISKPLEFKVDNIKELAKLLGISYWTLRRVLYDPEYRKTCTKFNDLFSHMELIKITDTYSVFMDTSNVIKIK